MKQTRYISTNIRQVEGGKVSVIISKEIFDRHGTLIDVSGISIHNFLLNPIVFWGHRSSGEIEDVVGRAENLRIGYDPKGIKILECDIVFASHPKAKLLERMVADDFINGISIGFDFDEVNFDPNTGHISESELMEISFVGIPSNTGVKVQRDYDFSNLDESSYIKLLNYEDIKPVLKIFRKYFLADDFCKRIGYTKTGSEILDAEGVSRVISDMLVAKVSSTSQEENPLTTEASNQEPSENHESSEIQQQAQEEGSSAGSQDTSSDNNSSDPKLTEQTNSDQIITMTLAELSQMLEDAIAKLRNNI